MMLSLSEYIDLCWEREIEDAERIFNIYKVKK
jgi:hypothetical protein